MSWRAGKHNVVEKPRGLMVRRHHLEYEIPLSDDYYTT
jgi:hypothetical protein